MKNITRLKCKILKFPVIGFILLLNAVIFISSCNVSNPAPEYPEDTPFIHFQRVEVQTKPITIDEEVSFIGNLVIGLLHREWEESTTHWRLTVNDIEMASDTLTNPQKCVDGCYNKLHQIGGDSLAQLFGTGELQTSFSATLETPKDSIITIDTTYSFMLYEEEPE